MNKFLNNWHYLRILRLLIGIGLVIIGFASDYYLFFPLAGIFLMQAFFNMSCCGSYQCNANTADKTKQNLYGHLIKKYKAENQ